MRSPTLFRPIDHSDLRFVPWFMFDVLVIDLMFPQVVVNVETHEMIDVDNPSKVDVEWNDTKGHSPDSSVNAQ